MTKDEMKNRISMALKDPILQQGFEIICKNLLEFERKISVLLSCKNCPENKGGLLCQKEYEDKCLTQKIQYIKELKEENNVLAQNLEDTEILNKTYEKRFEDLEKENAELKNFIMQSKKDGISPINALIIKNLGNQLTKAKEIIKKLINACCSYGATGRATAEAEQFLIDCEVKK
jgi:hypothetical protein